MIRSLKFQGCINKQSVHWFSWIVISCLLVTSVASGKDAATTSKADADGFVSLFDGESLKGWTGNLKYFRVQDGAIVGGTMKEKVPNNEFLTYAKKFADFELRLKAKLVGKGGNAGIQIRSRRPTKEELASDDKKKRLPPHEMVGYQVDMGKAWNKVWWGKLYDESRRRKVLAEPYDEAQLEKITKWDDWNDYRVWVKGNQIKIWLNGTQTVDYVEKEKGIAMSGLIGLQIHGGPPSEASYKDIRIKELK